MAFSCTDGQRCIHQEDGVCAYCRAKYQPHPELQIIPAVPEKKRRDEVPIDVINSIIGELPDDADVDDERPPTIN